MRVWLKSLLLAGVIVTLFPQWAGAQTVRTATLSSATCPGTGCSVVGTTGVGAVGISVTGTFVGTITFKASVVDNPDCSAADYAAINVTPFAATSAVTTATAPGRWSAGVGGTTYFCAVFTSYSSGSAVVAMKTAPTTGRAGVGGGGGGSGSGDALVGDPLSQFAATSSPQFFGVMSTKTGTNLVVFNTDATFVRPILGVATATSYNKVTITAPATGATFTLADGKTFVANNSMTFTGTDLITVAFGNGGTPFYTGVDGNSSGQIISLHLSAPNTIAMGGTGLSAGTSGGVLCYTASNTAASSASLPANRLVLGGGAGVCPTALGSLGTTTSVYHGNAAGPGSFGAVSLTADVAGITPPANGGTGIAFVAFAGPTVLRTYTGPDANSTLLTTNAVVTVPQGGLGVGTVSGIMRGNGTSAVSAIALDGDTTKFLNGNGAYSTPPGSGTVTSMTVTVPAFLTATGCVVTTSGTCAITTTSQAQNKFLGAPVASSGAMTPRVIDPADLPTGITEVATTTGQTLTCYGCSYEITFASPATLVLPTTATHAGASLGFRGTSTTSDWTLDGNGSQQICDAEGCATTKTYSANQSKLLIADLAGAYWQVISGEKPSGSSSGGGAVTETAQTGNATLAFASPVGRKSYTVDCSGCTLTLPTKASHVGEEIEVRALSTSGCVIIDGASAETIDGTADKVICKRESTVLRDTSAEWVRVGGQQIALTARAASITDQAINGDTWTELTLPILVQGDADLYDAGNDRITIPRTSAYSVTAIIEVTNPAARYYIGTMVNGVVDYGLGLYPVDGNGARFGIALGSQFYTKGDYVSVSIYSTGGTPATVSSAEVAITEALR